MTVPLDQAGRHPGRPYPRKDPAKRAWEM